jgi:hypothetical protein
MLKMIELSPPERKRIALKLNGELEKMGFETNMLSETEIQVDELAIPKIVPFDTASLSIRVEGYGIYFAITIKFINVLEDVTEAEEINKVYEQHAEWSNKELPIYLGEIDSHAKLKWDVEYDVDIEDTLFGIFDSAEDVITLARNLKELLGKKKADN